MSLQQVQVTKGKRESRKVENQFGIGHLAAVEVHSQTKSLCQQEIPCPTDGQEDD